jgi:hypothetical protein
MPPARRAEKGRPRGCADVGRAVNAGCLAAATSGASVERVAWSAGTNWIRQRSGWLVGIDWRWWRVSRPRSGCSIVLVPIFASSTRGAAIAL